MRLFFIALWGLADREGLIEWRPKRIKFEAFPYDEDIDSEDIKNWTQQLVDAGFVQYASVSEIQGSSGDAIACLYIANLVKHQRPHPNEAKSKFDVDSMSLHSGQCSPGSSVPSVPSRPSRPSSTSRTFSSSARTGEKGLELERVVTEVIEYFRAKSGKTRTSVKAESNRKFVRARIQEGASTDDLKAIVDLKVEQAHAGEFDSKYVRIETLFNATKFQSYLGEMDCDGSGGGFDVQAWRTRIAHT